MAQSQWKYIAQHGFFSHDNDPESWEFRATTLPRLGLLEREYPTNDTLESHTQSTQWEHFQRYVQQLNQEGAEKRRYKVFYIIRHGEGVHNVKEQEVGRAEWDRHWAKLPGDGATTWADAELVTKGEEQARELAAFWTKSFKIDKIPPPQSIYSSPLRRCLRTTTLTFDTLLTSGSGPGPIVKEKLRERLGVHYCDRRSTKTWIAEAYPSFKIEDGFTEEDELWQPDRRETLEEHISRSTELLDDIFENDPSIYISLTAHSGALMAIFAATGWKKVPVKAGAVYPLLVCRESAP